MSDLSNIRSRIEALGMGFQFVKTIRTSMNGIEGETWLLEYEGSQFVYVAGRKNVTLGWDTEKCPLGDGVLAGLRKDFAKGHEYYYEDELYTMKADYEEQIEEAEEKGDSGKADELRAELAEEIKNFEEDMEEKGYSDWERFFAKWNGQLAKCLSPLRTADIGDMLVETDNRSLEEDAPSLEAAVAALKKGPFTLATEDEWEYLCNGGAATLFRWGDSLDDVIEEIYRVGTVGGDKAGQDSILERPNMLGLFIAYDSYQMEIIDSISYTKGGDGGCSLCGGDGSIYVLPCYTAFYREPVKKHRSAISKRYYCYRRILRLP